MDRNVTQITIQTAQIQFKASLTNLHNTCPGHRVQTEWQWPLSDVHSIIMEKSAQPSEGGGVYAPPPFHCIYHHKQSCGVRSSWEGRYTPPFSSLPLHVLCGPGQCHCALLPGTGKIFRPYQTKNTAIVFQVPSRYWDKKQNKKWNNHQHAYSLCCMVLTLIFKKFTYI